MARAVKNARRWDRARPLLFASLASCALLIPSALAEGSSVSSAAKVPNAKEVRSIGTREFGFARPSGVAYSRRKKILLVAAAVPVSGGTRALQLGAFEDARGTVRLPELSPSTMSFDRAGARLIAVSGKKLVIVESASLATREPSVRRVDIASLELRNPRGATFDPTNGTWLILDSATREIVRLSASGRPRQRRISLSPEIGARRLRGLARNTADGLLYVAAPDKDLLYAVARSGKVKKTYSIKDAAFRNLTGMVFAPSADTTDSPSIQHLYVADAGGPSAYGRVVELSLEPAVELADNLTGTLGRTIHTSRLRPAAPDPSGITYLGATDTLLISDSEVDEMPIYRGANLFRVTRRGTLVEAGTTLPYSYEPTGLGLDPRTGALYVSDDDKRRVFVVRPGPDGRYGTADDSVTGFSTVSFGSFDPEGVELDPDSGHLYVVDGINAEIYDIDPVNGVFGDGDDVVSHFDVAQYGIRNCEGIGYDRRRKTLLLINSRERRIYELTKAGALIRIISLSKIPDANPSLASITVAPTSDPSDSASAMSYWVADRGVDNNDNPKENDGKIYEVKLP